MVIFHVSRATPEKSFPTSFLAIIIFLSLRRVILSPRDRVYFFLLLF